MVSRSIFFRDTMYVYVYSPSPSSLSLFLSHSMQPRGASLQRLRNCTPVEKARRKQVTRVTKQGREMADVQGEAIEPASVSAGVDAPRNLRRTSSIRIEDLPAPLQAKVRPLDISGDGAIDMNEFNEAVDLWVAASNRAAKQAKIIAGLVIFVILLLGANCGLTYGILELAKDNEVRSNGLMTLKDSNTIVRTASADFRVVGGSLTSNAGVALATGAETSTIHLSSHISDAHLNSITRVQLPVYSDKATGKAAMISLSISGYQKELDGSKLVLFAKSGARITIVGETISATMNTNGVETTLHVVPEQLRSSLTSARRRRASQRRRSLLLTDSSPYGAFGPIIPPLNLPVGQSEQSIQSNQFNDSKVFVADTKDYNAAAPAAGCEIACSKSKDMNGKVGNNCDSCPYPLSPGISGTCECPPGFVKEEIVDDSGFYNPPLVYYECKCPNANEFKGFNHATMQEQCMSCPPGQVANPEDPYACVCPDGTFFNVTSTIGADADGTVNDFMDSYNDNIVAQVLDEGTRKVVGSCSPLSCGHLSPDHVSVGGECICPIYTVQVENRTLMDSYWASYDAMRDSGFDGEPPAIPTGGVSCQRCGEHLQWVDDKFARGRGVCECALGPTYITVHGQLPPIDGIDQWDAPKCKKCPSGSIANRWGTRCECEAPYAASAIDIETSEVLGCAPCPAHAFLAKDGAYCVCSPGYLPVYPTNANGTIAWDNGNLLNFTCVDARCSSKGMVQGVDGACECRAGEYLDAHSGKCQTCLPPFVLQATDDPKSSVCVCPDGFVKTGPLGAQTCSTCGANMSIVKHGSRSWCSCKDGYFRDPQDESVCKSCPRGLDLVMEAGSDPKCMCPKDTKKTLVVREGTFGRNVEDYDVQCESIVAPKLSPITTAPGGSQSTSVLNCVSGDTTSCLAQFKATYGVAPNLEASSLPTAPVWIKNLLPRPTPSTDLGFYQTDSSGSLSPVVTIGSVRARESLSNWMLYAFDTKDYLQSCYKFPAGVSTSPISQADLSEASVAKGEYTLAMPLLPEAGLIVLFKDTQNAYTCPGQFDSYEGITLGDMQFWIDLEPESTQMHDKLLYNSDTRSVDYNGLSLLSEIYRDHKATIDAVWSTDTVHDFMEPVVIPKGGGVTRESGPSFPAVVFETVTTISLLEVAANPVVTVEHSATHIHSSQQHHSYGAYGMYGAPAPPPAQPPSPPSWWGTETPVPGDDHEHHHHAGDHPPSPSL